MRRESGGRLGGAKGNAVKMCASDWAGVTWENDVTHRAFLIGSGTVPWAGLDLTP